jgi:hypothetical protein
MDQVFSRVEAWRVNRGVQEVYRDPLGPGDFRQQLGQGGLHRIAMDAAVVQDEYNLAKTELSVAQDDEGKYPDDVFSFRFRLKVDGGLAAVQVQGQETVQLVPLFLVAGQRGGGVFFRPGIMSIRRGLKSKLVYGDVGGIGAGLLEFFFSVVTNAARSPGREGP